MATGKNTTARKIATNFVVADIKPLVTSSVSFNQGDFLIMDTTDHIVAAPASETDGANLLGVASVDIVDGVLRSAISTDVDASLASPSIPGPSYGDEFLVVLKNSVTAHPGDALYLDPATGTRGVTTTGTKKIGVWTGAQFTGDGTTEKPAKIGARYPDDALKL